MSFFRNKIFKTSLFDKRNKRKSSEDPKYIYISKNKDLNRFLTHFRNAFEGSTEVNVEELKSSSKFLEKWKNKVYRTMRL